MASRNRSNRKNGTTPTIDPWSIVAKAREYIGTPWHHTARVKGHGIDCAGLLVCVSQDLGVPVSDMTSYTLGDEYELMVGTIEQYCRKLRDNEHLIPGDILVFRGRMMTNHCAFYNGDDGIIHAYNSPSVKRVVEHGLDDSWRDRIVGRYRYKGIVGWQP